MDSNQDHQGHHHHGHIRPKRKRKKRQKQSYRNKLKHDAKWEVRRAKERANEARSGVPNEDHPAAASIPAGVLAGPAGPAVPVATAESTSTAAAQAVFASLSGGVVDDRHMDSSSQKKPPSESAPTIPATSASTATACFGIPESSAVVTAVEGVSFSPGVRAAIRETPATRSTASTAVDGVVLHPGASVFTSAAAPAAASDSHGKLVDCCICMDHCKKDNLASVDHCNHKFCFPCITKWSKQKMTCPLCKMPFTKIIQLHRLKRGNTTKNVRQRDQGSISGFPRGHFIVSRPSRSNASNRDDHEPGSRADNPLEISDSSDDEVYRI